jgi:ribosomal protein S18 acetylase RimI-like enzyme
MEIKKYTVKDEAKLRELLLDEGDDWSCYSDENAFGKYKQALISSLSYVGYEGVSLCGYVRCRDDDGFGIYVYDLLVKKSFRGRSFGRMLMERVCADHPSDTVYVMSGVDGYYEKLGYPREGSVFRVCINNNR